MRITAEHVRELVESDAEDPGLVLLEGRVQVVPAADAGPGALLVTSREDLFAVLGHRDLSAEDAEAVAARLDTELTNLGG